MTINLIDFELIEINAGIEAEYVYISKKHSPFGIAWKLVRQCVQTLMPESRGFPKEVNVLTIKLWNVKAENIAFDITSFYSK
jgi:hypothetical protein